MSILVLWFCCAFAVDYEVSYLRDLAALSVPTNYVSGSSIATRKYSYENTFDYQECQIGQAYHGSVVAGYPWSQKDVPVYITSDSPAITAVVERRSADGDYVGETVFHNRPRILYILTYSYRPTLPSGQDDLKLHAWSLDGEVDATVKLTANKTTKFIPPAAWFPGLKSRDANLGDQEWIN